MNKSITGSEIFTFHLVKMPFLELLKNLLIPLYKTNINGLLHSESFCLMNLGESIISPQRYNWSSIAFFMWWKCEADLNNFIASNQGQYLTSHGWHVRMKKYRKWGDINEITNAKLDHSLADPRGSIVAVTLARLKLSQTLRFIKWGKPVEQQVRNHKGKNLAYAAIRPLNTFCTFSIWKNEQEMISMVNGSKNRDGEEHKLAMIERNKKPFHYEFATMRFVPISESGSWNGKSNLLLT